MAYRRSSFSTNSARMSRLAPGAPADPGLRLRVAEQRSARAELAQVYDLAVAERPGLYARTEPWWTACSPTCTPTAGHPGRYGACCTRTG
jgi:hypothetical protein